MLGGKLYPLLPFFELSPGESVCLIPDLDPDWQTILMLLCQADFFRCAFGIIQQGGQRGSG